MKKILGALLAVLVIGIAVTLFASSSAAASDRYVVMGQVYVTNNSSGVTESGRNVADITMNVNASGTVDFWMASGTTCTLTNGSAGFDGSPLSLSAGKNTVTFNGSGDFSFDITIGTAANTNDVNSWAASSGGQCGASIPTSADNFYADANSFTAGSQVLTVNAALSCLNMDWTGATNTPRLTSSATLNIYGNATFITAMTHTGVNYFYFKGAANKVLTTNGLVLAGYIDKATTDFTLTLADGLSCARLMVERGTIDTNNQTVTVTGYVSISNTNLAILTLGNSIVNTPLWSAYDNGVISPNTATINCSGNFAGGGITTYNIVNLTGATSTVSGSNTFATLNFINPSAAQTITLTAGTTQTVTGTFTGTGFGTADANRLDILSSSAGSSATINAATVALTKADCKDLIGAGAGSWAMGATDDVRHVSGGSGITYRLYWVADTGNWSDITKWQTVSGGTTNALIAPDSVTSAYFDANSFTTGSQTVTVDAAANCKDLSFLNATNAPTLVRNNVYLNIYGNATFISAMTVTPNVGSGIVFKANGNLTSAGRTLGNLYFNTAGVTTTLLDELNIGTQTIYVLSTASLVTGGNNVTCGTFSIVSGSPIITFSTSTITCTSWSNNGTPTLTPNTATINCSGNFAGGGITTYNIVNLTGATSTISGNNSFSQLNLVSGTTQTITFTAGTTQTISTTSLSGSAGHVHTLTSAGNWSIVDSDGGTTSASYIALKGSQASGGTFTVDCYGTDNGDNSGWVFTQNTVTYVAGANGTINGSWPESVNCGSNGSWVLATGNACYHFLNWSDASTTNPRRELNVTSNVSYTANFAIDVLTVTYVAGANGTINGSWPKNVNCGSDGSWVLATPNACYHFVNWSDSSTTNPRRELNVTSNVSYTANFAVNTSIITYLAGANGTINGTAIQTVNCGSNSTSVTAIPNACYHFTTWSDANASAVRTDLGTSTNQTYTASFAINTSTLTLSSTAGGDVTTPSEGIHTYNCGQVINLIATADVGYTFVNWTGNGSGNVANVNASTTTITINSSNVVVTANFQSTSIVEPPTNFVTTLVGNCLDASWTMGINASGTLVILFEDTEHTDCTIPIGSGTYTVIFNGSGTAFTTDYCLLDVDEHDYYISAWGIDGTGNVSDGCVRVSLTGGESVIAMISIGVGILIALMILGFSFWQRQWWLFIVDGLIWFIIMAFIFIQYTTDDMLYWFGYVCLIMAIICIGCIFWFREKQETIVEVPEETQEDKREKRSKKLSNLRNLSHRISGRD